MKKRYLLGALSGALSGAAGFPAYTLSGFLICVASSFAICLIAAVVEVSNANK